MSSPPGQDGPPGRGRPYDDVRERLVSLGYLDSSLDRFVLSSVGHSGSFLAQHAAVSLRVAVSAGPLLGILFCAAVVFVNRPRFSSVADCVLLGVYFSILFAAIIFVLELAAGVVLAGVVRWRGRGVAAFPTTAARAGFGISLVLTAYLAFWWRRRTGGSAGVMLDLAGLSALVLVNAALLRVSSLASLAALVRVSDLPPRDSPGKTPHTTWLLALLAAALLSLGFFLAPGGRGNAELPFEPGPVRGRLFVIAWDGLTPQSLATILASPQGPADRLASPHRLAYLSAPPEGPGLSRAAYWTEVATGRVASEHGVTGTTSSQVVGLSRPLGSDVPLGMVLTTLLPGRRVAVSAGVRRAPAVWEILSRKEKAGSVGWWATWPAIAPPGSTEPHLYILSDRALMTDPGRPWPPYAVSPGSLAARLSGTRLQDLSEIRRSVTGLLQGNPGAVAGRPDSGRIARAALLDGYAIRAAERLLELEPLADLFVYLPGLDILRSEASAEAPVSAAQQAGYVEFVLERVRRLADRMTRDDWLIIVADTGRGGIQDPSPSGAVRGGVAVYGPDVAPGADLRVWSPLDVAPTLLWLRGFPASKEMTGRVRDELTNGTWRAQHPLRTISTYGETSVPALPGAPDAADEEALERLRSLGYVK